MQGFRLGLNHTQIESVNIMGEQLEYGEAQLLDDAQQHHASSAEQNEAGGSNRGADEAGSSNMNRDSGGESNLFTHRENLEIYAESDGEEEQQISRAIQESRRIR